MTRWDSDSRWDFFRLGSGAIGMSSDDEQCWTYWLRKEWLRGIQRDKGPPSRFPSILLNLYALVIMSFGTNNSNCVAASLFPHVLGTRPCSLFQLDSYVGTISQLENQCFERSFNLSGPYPTIQHVSLFNDGLGQLLTPLMDCGSDDWGEGPDGYSSSDSSSLGSRLPVGLFSQRPGLGMEHLFQQGHSL